MYVHAYYIVTLCLCKQNVCQLVVDIFISDGEFARC